MQLYAGDTARFVQDAIQNAIADCLSDAFQLAYRHAPGPGEVESWRNSLRAMSSVLQEAALEATSVALEYQLPLSSRRLDCLVFGEDQNGQDHGVIVELKQWDKCRDSDVDDCVLTWVGGGEREVLHPSVQVGQYRTYLADMHSAFYDEPRIELAACSYLHNLNREEDQVLQSERFRERLEQAPLFFGDDLTALTGHLNHRLGRGDRNGILARFQGARCRASRQLMHHVADMIDDNPVFTLLDEQHVVFQKILSLVRSEVHRKRKSVVLIHGGPGTGKSLIAASLLGRLSRLQYQARHATGSKAFTSNLQKSVGTRAATVFNYFNQFVKAEPDELDVLICDEAHRIRQTSNHRFTKKDARSEIPQVDELVRAARVSVFFIDDLQIVRPGEVGNSELIRSTAAAHDADVHEHTLDIQFRCNGSDAFIQWIDNTFGIRRTPVVMWNEAEAFDFRIVPDVQSLETLIRSKASEGQSARLAAGYCWPWSKKFGDDGRLVEDVEIGDWRRPWNARPELTRLPLDIPKSNFWATDPNGIDQVGCVYTAQGFEFDYVGVIIGSDLVYDPALGDWVGQSEHSADPVVRRAKDRFRELVANTYRVLLSRGMKGCFVTFLDKNTEEFVRSRIERRAVSGRPVEQTNAPKRRTLEVAESGEQLSRLALELWPEMIRCFGEEMDRRESEARAEAYELANDIANHLERPDLSRWREDRAVRARLERAVQRSLGGNVQIEQVRRFLDRAATS